MVLEKDSHNSIRKFMTKRTKTTSLYRKTFILKYIQKQYKTERKTKKTYSVSKRFRNHHRSLVWKDECLFPWSQASERCVKGLPMGSTTLGRHAWDCWGNTAQQSVVFVCPDLLLHFQAHRYLGTCISQETSLSLWSIACTNHLEYISGPIWGCFIFPSLCSKHCNIKSFRLSKWMCGWNLCMTHRQVGQVS